MQVKGLRTYWQWPTLATAIFALVLWAQHTYAQTQLPQARSWTGVVTDRNAVEVIDMGPVCLYVVRMPSFGTQSPAMWGISKTDLPAGRGCQ